MRTVATVFLLAFLCLAARANAQTKDTFTAGELQAECNVSAQTERRLREFSEDTCNAFMKGIMDGIFQMKLFMDSGLKVCWPPTYSSADGKRILNNLLLSYPFLATDEAGVAMGIGITREYYCP